MTNQKNARLLSSIIGELRPKGNRWDGLLGDHSGNIESVRDGEVYVRMRQAGSGSYAVGSFPVKGGLRLYYNLPVIIEEDPLTRERFVVDVDAMALDYGNAAGNTPPPTSGALETHALTHSWSEQADDQLQWLHTFQIFPLRMQPSETAQHVIIQAGAYYAEGAYRWLVSSIDLDLSTYYPTSGHKWVLIYLDGDGAAGVVDDGATTFTALNEPPSGTYAIGAAKLTFGAGISWMEDIVDLRFMLQNPGYIYDFIQFSLSYTGAIEEGRVQWNADDGTLEVGMPGGNVALQIGQEILVRAKNDQGADCYNGQVVYNSGASGQRPEFKLAQADSETTAFRLGVLTEDVANNQSGYVNLLGMLRDVDTSAWSDGDTLFLSATTAGAMTNVEPDAPNFRVPLGFVVYSHATEGIIYIYIQYRSRLTCLHDVYAPTVIDGDVPAWVAANSRFEMTTIPEAIGAITQEPGGFADPDNIVVSYDYTTREVTLTHVSGTIVYYVDGVKYELASPWTSDPHTATDDEWFLADSGSGPTWSTTIWAFSHAQFAYVEYDSANSVYFCFRECHGLMQWQSHYELHEVIGTYRESGGAPTGGTYAIQPSSPTTADNTPGFDAATVDDEDLHTVIPAWLQGTYTTLHFTGSGATSFDTAATVPYRVGTTFPLINVYTGGAFSEVEASNNDYFNVWQILAPAASDTESQKYRVLMLQPQDVHSTLVGAQLEDFRGYYLGDFAAIAPEYVAYVKITYRTNSSYTGATGRCRIEAISYITGSRASQVVSGGVIYGQATTETQGVIELATNEETALGADTERAIVPSGLRYALLEQANFMPFTTEDGMLLFGPGCRQSLDRWVSQRNQVATITGAFQQVQGKWPDTLAIHPEAATTNLVKNPVAGNGTTGYASAWGDTISLDTAEKRFGEQSIKWTWDGVSGGGVYYDLTGFAASTDYIASMWVRIPSEFVTGGTAILAVVFGDSWANLGQTTITTFDKWARIVVPFNSGTNTLIRPTLYFNNLSITGSAYAHLDGVQVEDNDAHTTLCYGDLAWCAWNGEPHDSTSSRVATYIDINDYVPLLYGQDAFSVSMWIQAPYDNDSDWPDNNNPRIWDYNVASTRCIVYFTRGSPGTLVLYVGGNSTGASVEFSAGDWLHVVTTYDFSANVYRLYLNGELLLEETWSVSAPSSSTGSWFIGSSPNFWSWGGPIAEYAVIGAELDAEEVAYLYNSGLPMVDTGAFILPVDEVDAVFEEPVEFFGDDGLLLLGPGSRQYPSGWVSQRGQKATITGAFHQVQGRWPKTLALLIESTTTNYATNPVGNATTGWADPYGTVTVRAVEEALNQTVVRSTADTSGNDSFLYYTTASISLTSGDAWSASVRVRADQELTTDIAFYREWAQNIGGTLSVVLTPEWQTFSLSGTVNATGSYVLRLIINPDAVSNGQIIDVDWIQIEKTSAPTSVAWGDAGEGYAWSSTPHASNTVRTATDVNLDDHAHLLNDKEQVSIAMWVQTPYDHDATLENDYGRLFEAYYSASERRAVYYNGLVDRFYLYFDGVGLSVDAWPISWRAGDWLHVVTTFDYTANDFRVYVNGELHVRSTASYSAPTNLDQFNLGVGYSGGSRFGGAFAEFAIIEGVLSYEKVRQLYEFGLPLVDLHPALPPAENIGPNHGSWHIFYGSASETAISYTAVDHTEFGWGGPVSGKLQLEALMKGTTPSTTAYAILEWDDSGTWREVSQSEISVTGTTESLARSAVFSLPPDERMYRLSLMSDTGSMVYCYRAALICTPGGLAEL